MGRKYFHCHHLKQLLQGSPPSLMSNNSRIKHLDNFPSSYMDIGEVEITPAARKILTDDDVKTALTRHSSCDFGEVSLEHHNGNLVFIEEVRGNVSSNYTSCAGEKFCIITRIDEFDPKTTIALLQ